MILVVTPIYYRWNNRVNRINRSLARFLILVLAMNAPAMEELTMTDTKTTSRSDTHERARPWWRLRRRLGAGARLDVCQLRLIFPGARGLA